MYSSYRKETSWCVRVVNGRESEFRSIEKGENDKVIYVGGFIEDSTGKRITAIIRFVENYSGNGVLVGWKYGFEGTQYDWDNSWSVSTINHYEDGATGYLFGSVIEKKSAWNSSN